MTGGGVKDMVYDRGGQGLWTGPMTGVGQGLRIRPVKGVDRAYGQGP